MTSLLISTDWKKDNYDSILVIIDRLTKIVHYKPVKININTPGVIEIIINMVVWHHDLFHSIVTNKNSLFTSKFWSLLCYFLGIKHRLSTTFHPQTDCQTKRQNSTIEVYLWAFVNFKQNDWARLLLIVEFVYNNIKNASSSHTPFKLNCGYYLCIVFEEDIYSCCQLKTVKKLFSKVRELMTVCRKNLYHAQKLQKQAHNKGVKLRSYASNDKVWLNGK